uniref:Uncharacterized protein n=1 Tax=Nothobranchius kadleci TaxID=1051664 RepID=A0A1A8D2G0_NOTKA
MRVVCNEPRPHNSRLSSVRKGFSSVQACFFVWLKN